ncbi:uncharacterized protein LOC118608677 isoform X2 [Rousettus aegyptiacus]|uniref:uncharacterized protein LOC118608677 isoform X2 n=1 Tax=Rousettus aegyptiacus TaxID=9407 RepID=UPI00168D4EDF|nr:uncharacterized protein LOC118608677 isoform X2 [Rousettus aegyptiacus]
MLSLCQVHPKKGKIEELGHRERGTYSGDHREVDFTEGAPTVGSYKYLLVSIDTFSGWVEAFPTRKEAASVVTKKLLHEILPRFGLPGTLGSDNRPAFVAKVSQSLASCLNLRWKLHCAYRPQSSGRVNKSDPKRDISQVRIRTWRDLGRTSPLRFSPSQALRSVQKEIWSRVRAAHSAPGDGLPHRFQPGDSVCIWKFTSKGLGPKRKGPVTVYLTTPTAVEVDGIPSWTHRSRARAAREWTAQEDGPLRLRLKRTYVRLTLCFFLSSSLAQAFDQPQPEPEGTLITLLTIIHKTMPDTGQDCWLCLNPKPPSYVENEEWDFGLKNLVRLHFGAA